jgi:hypothetical protein
MALTKAERAVFDNMRDRASLGLPGFECPVPLSLEFVNIKRDATGVRAVPAWFYSYHPSGFSGPGEVTLGWTDGGTHCRQGIYDVATRYNGRTSASQGMGTCYASKKEAMRALRWEATRYCMRLLGTIDGMLAELEGKDPDRQSTT